MSDGKHTPLPEDKVREIRERWAGVEPTSETVRIARTDIITLCDALALDRAEIERLNALTDAQGKEIAWHRENKIDPDDIESATRTERERCAKIARDFAQRFTDPDARAVTCRSIARAIEEPSNG